MYSKELISSFWNWFLAHSSELSQKKANNPCFRDLDEWMLKLGDFNWEIGPGYKAANMLVISPRGSKDLLIKTKNIVGQAPSIDGWEFYYCRQPLQGKPVFLLHTNGTKFKFDASEWEYVLLGFPDNTFDIILKAKNLEGLSEGDKFLAVELAMDGIIGEEKKIELIKGIDLVNDFSEEEKNSSSAFIYLLKHLKDYFKNHGKG